MNGQQGLTWGSVAQAAAVLVPLGVTMVIGYLKLASRLTRIETTLESDDKGRADRARGAAAERELELIRHCEQQRKDCPAYADWVSWHADSKVQTPDKR